MHKNATMYHTHSKIIRRLQRADGHLRTIIQMIEHGRPCLEISQQLQAVERAILNAKKALIHDHIDHCLDRSVRTGEAKGRAMLREFRAIAKYL
jgi:DNA-binding FrmR family transcriptional regulator